ncbi:uncharacterized protein LOC110230054 [Arabidopsis lyrata subsp. lyrata]|uniref:uncharacterized protein LOC110230054 n=1 Tax=Arabidopsis lyrata subsp. lyrata TaxID=81972 RepID=UPI000A29E2A9|nr:uncharacterized protein LOC110230054 [Arabidopsis lyrata subsp. lyrata]|eukprot:XP_020887611.1 uncharacterized protein LOC110230054 [Arabidopsis lyrata subsp. lyrata]
MAAANNQNERCYGVTNIKNQIPVHLDENEHNYDAWRELLPTHCMAFDVSGHLDGSLQPANANDHAWLKRDGLVKLWLYGTMAQPLFRSSFQPGGTARDLWLRVENQFRNNRDARAIQLDNELRTMEIGDMTVPEYCQKMKSTANLLSNVGTPVNDRTLVMYIINGLNDKFDNIINVIKHKDPFPSFDSAKSMLEWEETRLKKPSRASASHADTSSSSTALTTTSSQQPQFSTRHRNTINGAIGEAEVASTNESEADSPTTLGTRIRIGHHHHHRRTGCHTIKAGHKLHGLLLQPQVLILLSTNKWMKPTPRNLFLIPLTPIGIWTPAPLLT